MTSSLVLEERAIESAEYFLRAQFQVIEEAGGGLRRVRQQEIEAIERLYDTTCCAGPDATNEWITNLVARAKDGGPDDGARIVAAHLISRGESLPPHLRAYIVGVLQGLPKHDAGRRKRGPDSRANLSRDAAILQSVYWTSVNFDIAPTRNLASREKGRVRSACAIVTEALARIGVHMSEDAVQKIWGRYKRWKD